MAKKKKGIFGTIAAIGAIAGATAAVYAKRKEIRALIEETAARFLPTEEAPEETESWTEEDGTDIVIDRTTVPGNEENAEDTPAE